MPYPQQIDVATLGARALAVAEARGWEAWTLRDVADALGVTANALYRHVDDRAGLVIAMGEAATLELLKVLSRKQRSKKKDVDAEVVELSSRFVSFAAARPHAYAAFMNAKPALDHPAQRAWMRLWAHVNDTVRRAVPSSGDAASFALWALLHGRVGLWRGAAYRAPVDAGLHDAVRALMSGFRTNPPAESPLPEHARLDPPDG